MAAAIKGHQAAIKVFRNGQQLALVPVTKFNVNQDSSFNRTFYVGNAVGEGDQSIEGWSGSIDAEVKNAAIDDLIDAIVTGNQNGLAVDEVTIVDVEFYADGSSSTYVYSDIQLKMGKSVGGLNEKMTKKLDFQASTRTKVA